jgi:hypothetical protein
MGKMKYKHISYRSGFTEIYDLYKYVTQPMKISHFMLSMNSETNKNLLHVFYLLFIVGLTSQQDSVGYLATFHVYWFSMFTGGGRPRVCFSLFTLLFLT